MRRRLLRTCKLHDDTVIGSDAHKPRDNIVASDVDVNAKCTLNTSTTDVRYKWPQRLRATVLLLLLQWLQRASTTGVRPRVLRQRHVRPWCQRDARPRRISGAPVRAVLGNVNEEREWHAAWDTQRPRNAP